MKTKRKIKTRFTPGPWQVWRAHESVHAGVTENIPYSITAKRMVAQCEDMDDETDGEKAESAANAQLISTAPEMYDLLTELEQELDGDGACEGPLSTLNRIRNLLNKATKKPRTGK